MPGKQGFASMPLEKRRAIASKGGKKAHIMLVAHRWTSEEAQAAGRKGGTVCQARKAWARLYPELCTQTS